MSRTLRALFAAGLGTVALGVPAGPPAARAAATTTICVGIVVDYGDAKPGGGANSFCARVATGATGADVLATRARALGRPQPVYRSDGLLCTIDGYPNDGSCGAPAPGGGYRYWSYWHKFPTSSTWTYSQSGPSGFTVSDGLLEGWAFQNGGAERGRLPPAVSYSSVCLPAASPTPRVTPAASPVPSRSPVRSSAPPPATRPPARTTAPGGRSSSPKPPGTPVAPVAPVASTSPTNAVPPSAAESAEPSVTALSPVDPPRRPPSRLPAGAVAGVVLAAGIGGAAVLRARSGRS